MNSKVVRKLLAAFTGTDEQKRKVLTEALKKLEEKEPANDAKISVVRVNCAAAQFRVFVTLNFNGRSFKLKSVLLDSGAWICIRKEVPGAADKAKCHPRRSRPSKLGSALSRSR